MLLNDREENYIPNFGSTEYRGLQILVKKKKIITMQIEVPKILYMNLNAYIIIYILYIIV